MAGKNSIGELKRQHQALKLCQWNQEWKVFFFNSFTFHNKELKWNTRNDFQMCSFEHNWPIFDQWLLLICWQLSMWHRIFLILEAVLSTSSNTFLNLRLANVRAYMNLINWMYDSQLSQLQNYCALNTRRSYNGCVFTMPVVSLNIPESVIITD